MKENKKVLVALAWPYANGSLHLGHIASSIGADILARYHRQKGDDVLFVSGSDCYGTPIALEAFVRNISPEEIAEHYHKEFKKNLIDGLNFSYTFYSKTTSPYHKKVVQDIFLKLYEKGHIYKKEEDALYSPNLKKFLPDRFVEGECPYCGYVGARGDQCDDCGKLLDALQLKNPHINKKILLSVGGVDKVGDGINVGVDKDDVVKDTSIYDKKLPLEVRKTTQFFLRLSAFQGDLETWVEKTSSSWRPNARQFTASFIKQGLRDRAITRDIDWGIPIPIKGYEDKRIYVWFEAVLGYLSASKEHHRERWVEWWESDDAVHYYIHGKDNVPHHTMILPAILMGHKNLHLPDRVFSTEYLSLEGKQFSTSRSYAVWLPDFLKHFDSELLRYFLVVQGTETSDINFRWDTFAEVVNGELIGTFGNLINRVCLFVEKNFPDGVSQKTKLSESAKAILSVADSAYGTVGSYIEKGMFRKALREILKLAEKGNQYIHTNEPWKNINNDKTKTETDLFVLLSLIHKIALLSEPFLPTTTDKILTFLGKKITKKWGVPDITTRYCVKGTTVLFKKIEPEDIQKQKELLGIE